jgi:hypothetical protein
MSAARFVRHQGGRGKRHQDPAPHPGGELERPPRRHLIAYDRRRVKIANFLADCRPAKLIRIRAQLENLIRTDGDSILLSDLGSPDLAARDTM